MDDDDFILILDDVTSFTFGSDDGHAFYHLTFIDDDDDDIDDAF
jgi:hypothetical protein